MQGSSVDGKGAAVGLVTAQMIFDAPRDGHQDAPHAIATETGAGT